MISIIISSYQPEYFAALENNIAATVGVPYEIIKIDNRGLMGVCRAYNTGAKQAKFENLLFIHEDILFHTHNWGEKLINHLQDPETGIIGVAGSDYVPMAPSGWYVKGHSYLHLLQNSKNRSQPELINATHRNKQSVFALDGVFLAMQKAKFEAFRFDEEIAGFHAYDLDISLRFAKKYKNYVIGDILIEHFSNGNPDKAFFEENILVRKKCGSDFQLIQDSKIEMLCFKEFLYNYYRYSEISFINAFRTLKFIPKGRINFNDYIILLKTYYRYFKFKKYFKEKFATE
ncbi:MAG: glycosyltransferase [Kaistella sp.]